MSYIYITFISFTDNKTNNYNTHNPDRQTDKIKGEIK
jgi:hypothetical protein